LPLNAASPKATTKRDDPGRQDAAVASMMPRTPCSSASPPLPGTNGTELILLSAVAVLVVRLVNKPIVDGSLYHPVPVARLPKLARSRRMSLAFALAWLISSPMLPVVSNRNITSTTVLVGRVLTVTVLRTVVLSPTPSSAEKEVGAMAS